MLGASTGSTAPIETQKDASRSAGFGANVRLTPFNAKGDGRADDTAAIQAAIDSSPRVYLPAGIYLINPKVGLVLRNGTQIVGDGRASTVLLAGPGGGTVSQLQEYGPGPILHRYFDPKARNEYVTYVRLADFSVILNHPRQSITSDAIQIGIDFRNVSRSIIERVYVGNVAPVGGPVVKSRAHLYDSQGYGIIFGTVASSLPSYAGGEINVVRDSNVVGAYKAIVQDDETLSPLSGAHGIVVERTDLEAAQVLLSQESRYARGFSWRDNVLQNVVPQPGGNDQATVMRIDGRDVMVQGGYIEASGWANYLVALGPNSQRVNVDLLYASCTNELIILDRGAQNTIAIGEGCKTQRRRAP